MVNRPERAFIQRKFFSRDIDQKLIDNPILQIRTNPRVQLKTQLRNAIRDTFDIVYIGHLTSIDSHVGLVEAFLTLHEIEYKWDMLLSSTQIRITITQSELDREV